MYCSRCGAAVADGVAFCSACGQSTGAAASTQTQVGVLPPPAPQPRVVAGPPVLYAGFWLRVVAAIIDGLALLIPFGLIGFALFASAIPALSRIQQGEPPMVVFAAIMPRLIIIGIIYFIGTWLYWAGMESSEWQATLGKKALGLYVTDMEGRRTTFGRTSARFWSGRGVRVVPSLGALYFLIDCIMAGLTEKKQALHDIIANCLVLRKN
jgi:uncharacterized RDD family membrane protein YckC